MNDRNLTRNIKILVIFFSLCFFSIIVYLTYFDLFVANKIVGDPSNKRNRLAEAKVLRGSILDRDGEVVAYSQKLSNGEQKRIYKNGDIFAHAIGYNSYVYGKTGIEAAYNDVLQGKVFSYDILGTIFRSLKESLTGDEKRGSNVVLTLDKSLQLKAYKMLGKDKGAVVAMNPKTGEILAMVSKPTFNPGLIDKKFKEYNSDEEGAPLLNRATQGYYPPGSVFKIITAVSAIENLPGITKDKFRCTGKLKIGNYVLSDFGGESHGSIDLKNAFRESCNYTFGQLGIRLGFENLKKTAEEFMFNKDIPVDDEFNSLNIKEGKISAEDENSKSYLAQDAIGQHNVTANPMHMALVASTIANNGVMMRPYIVKEVRDRYGITIATTKPKILSEVIDSDTSDIIKGYMVEVVKSGTGTNAKISGITVAGKTGSAQDESKNATHSWFVCFAPAENPQIAVAVIVENGGLGGKRAAEIAREVMKEYFRK
jgi:peptidoglycan glycosyltransferase